MSSRPIRRDSRAPRPPRPRERRELRPRPIGDKCSPLCPFFKCLKGALIIRTEYYRGRPIKVPICSWTGDRCIGPKCRYAYCEKHAMLPDGRCAFAVQARAKRQVDFEEELKRESEIDRLEEEL